jgi:hypothetical protein
MKKRQSNHENLPAPKPGELLTEEEMQHIESDPEFQRMMRESEEDIRAGRVYTSEEVDGILSGRTRRR